MTQDDGATSSPKANEDTLQNDQHRPTAGVSNGTQISPDSHPDYEDALSLSSELKGFVQSLDLSRLMYKAAVIDRQLKNITAHPIGEINGNTGKEKGKGRTEWAQLDIMGWNKFITGIERSHISLEQQGSRARSSDPRDSPLPPIQSSLTFTKVILLAETPITGVRVTMGSKRGGQKKVVKDRNGNVVKSRLGKDETGSSVGEEVVDVICRGGAEWIKLWTKKESQMMSEFREQDSYANSDWSDSDSDSASLSKAGPSKPQLTNTLIETARSLLTLTKSSPRPPGTSPPSLTIRLTRMSPNPPNGFLDPRIGETFDLLRSLGINLQFGDLSHIPLSSLPRPLLPPKELLPSPKINLDPTALVGICSDALHHPVPRDMDEARKRYFRPRHILNPETATSDEGWVYDDHRQSQHSRELLKEAMDECKYPLIEELRDTLESVISRNGGGGGVEFWATEGALQHLKEAMSNTKVVGDGMEQQRMKRLIGMEEGDFWEGSRYEGKEGCLRDIKLRIFPSLTSHPAQPICGDGIRSLHISTSNAIRQFLMEYESLLLDPTSYPDIPPFLRPDRLPVPKVAELSVPLPIASLGSMMRGAEEGMTTLCMGNVVWRELFAQGRWKTRGWTQGNWELERSRQRKAMPNEDKEEKEGEEIDSGGMGIVEDDLGESEGNAVIWLMPYRSLGEGKRVRFEKGNYAFPVPK